MAVQIDRRARPVQEFDGLGAMFSDNVLWVGCMVALWVSQSGVARIVGASGDRSVRCVWSEAQTRLNGW